MKKFAEFFATFAFLGKIKYCPGTFGSLCAFPIVYMIVHVTIKEQIVFSFSSLNYAESELFTFLIISLTINILLFILGTYCSSLYVKQTEREDPKEVIIDEVVGQMLVINLSIFSLAFAHYSRITEYLSPGMIDFVFLFLLPFSLFRVFDIIKPWPINWLDNNIKGGIGIMLDDLLAAFFAVVTQYVITFLIIDWLGQ